MADALGHWGGGRKLLWGRMVEEVLEDKCRGHSLVEKLTSVVMFVFFFTFSFPPKGLLFVLFFFFVLSALR